MFALFSVGTIIGVMKQKEADNQIVIYQAKSGALELRADADNGTIWATQAEMGKVFNVNAQAITKHLKNIYTEGELSRKGTCSKVEQVQTEGDRAVRREVEVYNLDAIIAVGYRINSVIGTKFRQWATRTLRQYIVEGYAINRDRVAKNYGQFMEAVKAVKQLLPAGAAIDTQSVLELVNAFADTWLSLDAYDKSRLVTKGVTKKRVVLTAEKLKKNIADFKAVLVERGEATEHFAMERQAGSIEGIVGNVMQSFGGKEVYGTAEEKAAHLLYFTVKDHPFVDGNKRSGAYAFVWFLRQAGILDVARLTPPALTALTLLVAESNPKEKEKMIQLVLTLLARGMA
jgi:prophage maintenance system killer protein